MNTELRSFDAVLFDFADTLFDSRSALLPDVMAQHSADLGMRTAPEDCERWIEQVLAYVATPQGQARMQSCDYSPDLHRASWNTVVHACEGIPPAFAQPFYEVFCDAELWGVHSRTAKPSCARSGSPESRRASSATSAGTSCLPGCQSNDRTNRYRSAVVPGWSTQTRRRDVPGRTAESADRTRARLDGGRQLAH
ncbi:MAG: hypothetical protein CBHOC_1729 [uncultured Caballeronia sp.]|nr:MAG: hypothetical protein CBHOC_1729 [uncultured Caballeronia sp.]